MYKLIMTVIIGFISGWSANDWRHKSHELDATKKLIVKQQEAQIITEKHAEALEQKLEEKRTQDDAINEKINENVQKNSDNVCFDDDAARLFNDKINRSRALLSSKPNN